MIPRSTRLFHIRELPALLLLIVLVIGIAAYRPAFRSPENLAQVGRDAAFTGIMACGEALVILTGGIDLSVGPVAAMASCTAGARMMGGLAWPLSALLGLMVGGLAGWANGALITFRRLPPLLTTLAAFLILRALTNIETGALPFNQLPEPFTAMGRGNVSFIFFIAIAGLFAVLVTRTRFGRRVISIGGSETSARLSGVPVDAVLRRVYLLSGLCAALVGLLMSAAADNAQWNLGEGMELEAIAAVVIGGVRLSGGEGSMTGAALGALILVVLKNALFLSGVPSERYGLVIGGVILVAALAEQFRRVRQERIA